MNRNAFVFVDLPVFVVAYDGRFTRPCCCGYRFSGRPPVLRRPWVTSCHIGSRTLQLSRTFLRSGILFFFFVNFVHH